MGEEKEKIFSRIMKQPRTPDFDTKSFGFKANLVRSGTGLRPDLLPPFLRQQEAGGCTRAESAESR
jgi:hypothetical protein